MIEVTRGELAAMTDQELLAYEREHYSDPYTGLLKSQGVAAGCPAVLAYWGGADEGGQRGPGASAASSASEVVSA